MLRAQEYSSTELCQVPRGDIQWNGLIHLIKNTDDFRTAVKLSSQECEIPGFAPCHHHLVQTPASGCCILTSSSLIPTLLPPTRQLFDICVRSLTAADKFEMDAGSIFLICFGVVFGSLLIGGWRFGHPLLIRYAKRKSSQRLLVQNPQIGIETAQGGQESSVTSGKTRNLNWASWRHRSAPSTSDDQSSPSPRASPASSLLSTILQNKSSCSSHKITELDIMKQPHDLYNMVAVPPVPKQCLSRRAADIGTQVSLLLPIIWHENVPLALASTL
jgi:hypothetical protein